MICLASFDACLLGIQKGQDINNKEKVWWKLVEGLSVVKIVGYTSKWFNEIVMPVILHVFKIVQLNLLKKHIPGQVSLNNSCIGWQWDINIEFDDDFKFH